MLILSARRFYDSVRAGGQPSLGAHGSCHMYSLLSLARTLSMFTVSGHALETLWYDLCSQGNDDLLPTLQEIISGSLLPPATNFLILGILEYRGGDSTCVRGEGERGATGKGRGVSCCEESARGLGHNVRGGVGGTSNRSSAHSGALH